MKAQELRKLIEESEDKLSIFANKDILKQYEFNAKELFDLIKDFLSDEEKLKLFDYEHFQGLNAYIRTEIIKLIIDSDIKLQALYNEKATEGIQNYEILKIITQLNDEQKEKILRDEEFLEKNKFQNYNKNSIISSLSEEAREKILLDKDIMINKLHLDNYIVSGLARELSNEQVKLRIIEIYQLENFYKVEIISTFSDKSKIDVVLQDEKLDQFNMIKILKTLDVEILADFLINNKEMLSQRDINNIFEITRELDIDNQKQLVEKLLELDFTEIERKEILASLKPQTKESVDISNFPEEYKIAMSIKTNELNSRIFWDSKRNQEDYRGLDNLLKIEPEKFSAEEKSKFLQLCDICPNLEVDNSYEGVMETVSTVQEYKEAEEWIESVINNIKPEYSKAQKMAVIDNAIGKKISYSPDYGTEVFDIEGNRALWKIISKGYGVCNGIATVEGYILKKVGIENELVGSDNHAFLKIKDIELPLANGEIVKGNTILDPTWNLTRHRFGGKPDNFCISYEEARKNDIDINGKDHKCHLNDAELQDINVSLDEQSLRRLFTSVGLADEEGIFPIKKLMDESEKIHEDNANNMNQNINEQFKLLYKFCPEFATCQNSSMSIISDILLDNEKLKFKKCVVDRVYDKEDKDKRPLMYIYIDSNEIGKKFYYADKEERKFIELTQEEFIKKFECYENDLQNNNGIRPWESEEQEEKEKNLATSSGKVVAGEGEER